MKLVGVNLPKLKRIQDLFTECFFCNRIRGAFIQAFSRSGIDVTDNEIYIPLVYISLPQRHLHGLIEPASRRMITILTETEPTLYRTKCDKADTDFVDLRVQKLQFGQQECHIQWQC